MVQSGTQQGEIHTERRRVIWSWLSLFIGGLEYRGGEQMQKLVIITLVNASGTAVVSHEGNMF